MAAGYFIGNRMAVSHGYDSLYAFLTTSAKNYNASRDPEISVEIKISDEEYAKLAKVREEALQRGVIVQPEDPYVKCTLVYEGKEIKARIRLKGKMTDHVEGDKWSFRVKTRKDDALLGMKRFSLQHPGTRNYSYEWIYHQLSREEGIAALRYKFINLKLNGDDLGVYALEEHFGQEIAGNNDRVDGPIFRFNPSLYWYFRLHELRGLKLVDEYTKFQSSYVDPFNEVDMMKDSAWLKQFQNALVMMEAFRRGERKASEVFDIEKFANRHAILDLVGGQHSADWSDVKFYYNPETKLIEPIAYESFSGRPIQTILGHYKFTGKKAYNYDFHKVLFNDAEFFSAYIASLQRMTNVDYLDSFFTRNEDEINMNKAVMHTEFPYKELSNEEYYRNAEIIRENLDVPQFFHAYVETTNADTLTLRVGSIEGLPAQITAIHINDTLSATLDNGPIVPAKGIVDYVDYNNIDVVIPGLANARKLDKIMIDHQLLGGNQTVTVEAFPYQHEELEILEDNYLIAEANAHTFPNLLVDEVNKMVVFPIGITEINRDLIIGKGYTVVASGGVTITLNDSAKIISHSVMRFEGNEDNPVYIHSEDSTGQGVILINAPEISRFKDVQFSKLGHPSNQNFAHRAMLTIHETTTVFESCDFNEIDAPKAVQTTDSKVIFRSTAFRNLTGDGVHINFGDASFTDIRFENIGDDALIFLGGNHDATNVSITNCASTAILVKEHAKLKAGQVSISQAKTALEMRDDGQGEFKEATITDCKVAAHVHKDSEIYGPSAILIEKLTSDAVEKMYRKGKTSRIIVNGEEISAGQKLE